jgi:hypothetical protein
MSSKDPILGKSELSIDTKTNFESFDNLKPSGPDNTWKTIAFLAGILGLLFLLVLPPLFTWLIASSINHEKLSKLKNDKNDELNNLVKEVNALEKNKNDQKESMLALLKEAELLKKENNKLEEQVGVQKELYITKNIEESKNLDDLKFKLNDKKFNGITGFKIPKNIIEDLLKKKGEQEKLIIKDGPKEKESWLEFIDKNKGKVLENGDVINKYLVEIAEDAKAKYEGYGKIEKYYKAKQWIDKDKDEVMLNNILKTLQKESTIFVGIINEANAKGLSNAFGILLPSECLTALAILINKNEKNLYFENECRSSLNELIKILLDKDKAHYNIAKITEYAKSDPNRHNIQKLQEKEVNPPDLINFKSGSIPKTDRDLLIDEFDEHLKKIKFKRINNEQEKVSKKAEELNRFIKKKIEDFMLMKGEAK